MCKKCVSKKEIIIPPNRHYCQWHNGKYFMDIRTLIIRIEVGVISLTFLPRSHHKKKKKVTNYITLFN